MFKADIPLVFFLQKMRKNLKKKKKKSPPSIVNTSIVTYACSKNIIERDIKQKENKQNKMQSL